MKKTLRKTKLLKLVILAAGVASFFALGTAQATDHYWNAGSGDFSTSANWDTNTVPVGGDNALINVSGTATITADVASSGSRLNVLEVGRWFGSGTVTQTVGTVYTAGFNVGFIGTGVYNLNGSGSINMTNDFLLGKAGGGADAGNGTLNMNTSGTFTTNFVHIADDSWGSTVGPSGTLNLSAGTLTSTYGFRVGGDATANTGLATVNLSGGVINSNGNFMIGDGNHAIGAFVMTGGTLNVTGPNGAEFWVGNSHNGDYSAVGHGTATISSGVLNVGSWFGVGRDGSVGTLTISGDAVVNQGTTDSGSRLELGNFGNNNNSTLNLNGGTLAVNGINDSGGAGDTTTFNFNGGTLKAREDNSNFLFAKTINVQNGGAVIDSNGYNIRIGNVLAASGTGGLTKNGAGQLEIANQNTFTGAVVVNTGTLYANSGSGPTNKAFSYSSGITVNSGATLRAQSNSLFGWDGSQAKLITINGGTAVAENGDLNVGQVTLNGGTLSSVSEDGYWGSWHFGRATDKKLLVTDNSTVSAQHVGFTGGATIEVAAGKNLNFTGTIGDAGGDGPSSVIKVGSGTLTLSGANFYTGGTTISTGILQLGNGGTTGSLSTSSTITDNGTLTINRSNAVAQGSDFSTGAITGTGSLTQAGSGTVVLNVANTYSGGTTVSAGRIEVTNNTALGSGAVSIAAGANVLLNANSLMIANNFTLNGTTSGGALVSGDRPGGNVTTLSGTITLAADSNIASWWNDKQLTLSGKITGSGSLTFDRATALGDPVGGKFLISGTTNDYTGSTTVNGKYSNAILQLGAENALPTGTTLTLNDATLSLNGFNQTLGGFVASTTTSQIVNGNAAAVTLTVNNAAANTFAGVLGGFGTNENNFALTKGGAGTLTLSGANTFTGATTVNAGTLKAGVASVANTSGAFGNNSAVTMANVATAILDITGFNTQIGSLTGGGTTGGNVTLGAATLTTGGDNTSPAAYAGVISGTGGALTKIGTGAQTLSGASTYSGGTYINSGTVTMGANSSISGGVLNNGPMGTGAVNLAGGTLSLGANYVIGNNIVAVAGTTSIISQTSGGAVAGIGENGGPSSLVTAFSGSGNITLSITDGLRLRNTDWSGFSGTLTLASGNNVFIAANSNFSSIIDLSHATLNLTTGAFQVQYYSNQTLRIGALSGSGGTITGNQAGTSYEIGNLNTNTSFAGVIANASGATPLTKTGTGTQTLSGVNTYTGATLITSGTLVAASSTGGALGSTSSVTVNTGGTLLLGGSNQINDSASLALSGGKLNTGGNNETLGALTLSANSTIDFSNGQGTLTFNSASYTGGTLTILNWAGNFGGGTTDHLLLNSPANSTFLSNVNFSGFGTGANQISFGGSQYELVPIPEPATIIGASALIGLVVLRERRRLTFFRGK